MPIFEEGSTYDYCQWMDGRSFAHYRQPHHYSSWRWCRDGQCCLLCFEFNVLIIVLTLLIAWSILQRCLTMRPILKSKKGWWTDRQTTSFYLLEIYLHWREEKRVCRPLNAFVARGSFKSSPRKLMVNFLILLNAMFGERDAFSADNRFRSALCFTFLFKAWKDFTTSI